MQRALEMAFDSLDLAVDNI